jgi:hypothetical protein
LHTVGNALYRLDLDTIASAIEARRCACGYFYEHVTDRLADIAGTITWKYQTLTYAGPAKDDLARFVADNQISGIDRIVPVGAAMDIGLVWDGYDLIATLSRVCDVR